MAEQQRCAACGKSGSDETNKPKACACKSVRYCNVKCQRAHRPDHKKECKRLIKELELSLALAKSSIGSGDDVVPGDVVNKAGKAGEAPGRAEDSDDDSGLFRPAEKEDCPICLLPLPLLPEASVYRSCCGKKICNACFYESQRVEAEEKGIMEIQVLCPFCRTPAPENDEESMARLEKRMQLEDAGATWYIGMHYKDGDCGLERDGRKALELLQQAAELGSADAHYNLAHAHAVGLYGLGSDSCSSEYHLKQAAKAGRFDAWNQLGVNATNAGTYELAYRYFNLSAAAGYEESLDKIKMLLDYHAITKDQYFDSLRAYKAGRDEMASEERDRAARSGYNVMKYLQLYDKEVAAKKRKKK